jgi:hypothetical protein
VMRTIVERRLRLPGRRCACPTNSALTLNTLSSARQMCDSWMNASGVPIANRF